MLLGENNRIFQSQVLSCKKSSDNSWELEIKKPKEFSFKSGQYIWLVLPNLADKDSREDRRAFSIASSPLQKDRITIMFRSSASIYKKSLSNLASGSPLEVIGPFGSSFVPNEDNQKDIVMIAGGVGIAPFLSILRFFDKNDNLFHFKLIWTNTSAEIDSISNELNRICSSNKINFINHLGSFRESILPENIDYLKDAFYISGPKGFVDEVYKGLNARGVPFEHMQFEQYYPTRAGGLTEDTFKEKSENPNIMLQAINDSNSHVIVTDANGQIIFANAMAEKITGYSFEEMRGNTPRLWGGMMDPDSFRSLWQHSRAVGGVNLEVTNRRKNGEIYYVVAHISPIIDRSINVIGFIGTEEDITQKIITSKLLEEQKNMLIADQAKDKAIFENLGDGLVIMDVHGVVVFVNKGVERLLGYTHSDIVGKKMVDAIAKYNEEGELIPPEERSVSKVLSGSTLHESSSTLAKTHYYISKDNKKIYIMGIVTPILINNAVIGAVQIFRDITHEKEVDRAKTEFISLASHQLRTPLSAMRWFAEMLLAGDAGKLTAGQKEYIQNIYDSNARLIEIVNSLLNISRIESGRLTIEPKPTDLHELLNKALVNLESEIKEKKMKVVANINQNLPSINIDAMLISQVYMNLISNAVKYTPQEGKITISIVRKNDELISQITDTGYGIPKKDIGRVFSKFFRADNIIKLDTNGNGLGLYLTKSIVESSGGKIWFESEEDMGTTFWFSLPFSGSRAHKGEVSISE